jgi:hypothetical protein
MPQADNPTFEKIWSTLSVINVNNYTEEKYGLTFLSWGFCWALLMKHFPQAQYKFDDNEIHPDGSVTVYCTVSIGECSRSMHLPVMNHKMAAIQNPTARDISDAKQRCLVKAISMHGLGCYLYCGEKTPESEVSEPQQDAEPEKVPYAAPVENVAPPAPDKPSPVEGEAVGDDEDWLPKDQEAADYWVKVTLNFIKEHCDEDSLKGLWEVNKQIVIYIQDKYPDTYLKLQAGFKEKYAELSKSKEKT